MFLGNDDGIAFGEFTDQLVLFFGLALVCDLRTTCGLISLAGSIMRVPARHIHVCCLPRIETEITGRSVAFFRRASFEVVNRTPASGSDVRA